MLYQPLTIKQFMEGSSYCNFNEEVMLKPPDVLVPKEKNVDETGAFWSHEMLAE